MTRTDAERVLHGSCLERLRELPDASIDAVVTDPPYGLSNVSTSTIVEAVTQWATGNREFIPDARGFMGKAWDAFVPPPAVWDECLRVLKPGGHLLAFAGSRTFDLMGLSIRFAGFEVRDSIAWLYGSGFPKSLDVSKAIDKAAGAQREVVGETRRGAQTIASNAYGAWGDGITPTAPATDDAKRWQGWGTALKPAFEPLVVARKPLDGTVAQNVLAHGTGALNIDACRIDASTHPVTSAGGKQLSSIGYGGTNADGSFATEAHPAGRWPSNVMLDEHAARTLDQQEPNTARFFYVAKTSTAERNAGLDHLLKRPAGSLNMRTDAHAKRTGATTMAAANHHPTVKPLTLMRELVQLVTPPDGVVLDPFLGSGTTACAAILEGFDWIGCELTDEYLPIIAARVAWARNEAAKQPEPLFDTTPHTKRTLSIDDTLQLELDA